MNAMAETVQSETLISLKQAAKDIGVETEETVVAACQRFNIPIVQISRSVRRMTIADYCLLIARAKQEGRPAKEPKPPQTAGVELLTTGEATLIDCIRSIPSGIREQISFMIEEMGTPGGDRIHPNLGSALAVALREPKPKEELND